MLNAHLYNLDRNYFIRALYKQMAALNNNVLDLIPSKPCDIYYPDPCSSHKAAYKTTVDTRFVQAMANLSAGSNTFTLPPAGGYQDVILQLQMPSVAAPTGLALNVGWGYSLIRQISYRIAGSSQYFLTGQQVLQMALKNCPDSQSKNDLLSLGGAAASGAGLTNAANFAYVWLPLPWTKPSSISKPSPLPSDTLSQQIVITVEFVPIQNVFSVSAAAGSVAGTIPTQLASAQFQVQQLSLDNKGDELAQRVDLTRNSLSYPCEFVQQEVTVDLGPNALNNVTTTLTGFRSGECRAIDVWLSQAADLPKAPPQIAGATTISVVNPFYWFAPRNIQMNYAGQVYARFDNGSGALWNLVNNRFQPQVAYGAITAAAGGGNTFTVTPVNAQWVSLPFAQKMENDTSRSFMVSGKNITNGIINLQFDTPGATANPTPGGGGNWILHASYVYNAVAVFGMGTCDLAF